MASKFQWKPFWLVTQLDQQNDWTVWQIRVNYDVFAQAQWDVCKSPGFPSNRVAAGQVDPPAVRITMVCSLFACCLSASEAFLFLSGGFAGSSATHTL